MTTTPLISVVMGVYNAEASLATALDGILTQDADLEFIIVDDGSTDRTREILCSAQEQDSRVVVMNQEHSGLTLALIAGCAAARGEFIARQDADDRSHPTRMRRLGEHLQADGRCCLATPCSQWVGPNQEKLWIHRPDLRNEGGRSWYGSAGGLVHGSVMFRRDAYVAVGGYRRQFRYAQDVDLWWRLSAHGGARCIDEVLYDYRFAPGCISADRANMQREFATLATTANAARLRGDSEEPFLDQAEALCSVARGDEQDPSSGQNQRARSLYFIASNLEKRGDARAYDYFRQAVRERPLWGMAWLRLLVNMVSRGRCKRARTGDSSSS